MAQLKTIDLEKLGRELVEKWAERDSAAFAALFANDGEYIDAAFGVRRSGRDSMEHHHKLWHAAISQFTMRPLRLVTAPGFIAIEALAEGRFDGEGLGGGKIKPTYARFRGRMCVLIDVTSEGKIARCTDYYDRSTMPGGQRPPLGDLEE